MFINSPIPDGLSEQLKHQSTSQELLVSTFRTLMAEANASNNPHPVFRVTDKTLLDQALKCFGPQISAGASFYELGIHKKTGALIIASHPAAISRPSAAQRGSRDST